MDEFLAKCITYMRNGGPSSSQNNAAPTSSRRRRTQTRDENDFDDDDDAAGQPLDWDLLGRYACFPYNSRPPVPTFLLGPLSVEKKIRSHTQRRAKQPKDTNRESRPEALSRADLQQTEDNGLTAVCKRVNAQLRAHMKTSKQLIEKAGFTPQDVGTAKYNAMLRKCRLSSNGGVSLFEYVVNPHSFGQTVENLFYISFLIKEGAVGVQHDSDGLPTLSKYPRRHVQVFLYRLADLEAHVVGTRASTLEQQREARTKRHQAVFALDFATWEQLIEAFDIREPMIEHRKEEPQGQMGARGWYT